MTQRILADEVVIISDFDGTITIQDSNDLLFKNLGNKENEYIEKLYIDGKIGTKEGMIKHFETMKLSEEDYTRFIDREIHIDKAFKDFCIKAEKKNILIVIVSGGFWNAIEMILRKEDIKVNEIYANRLIFNGNKAEPNFLHEIESCNGNFKTCGNCKLFYLDKYKTLGKKVIFIGDGLTDRCIAKGADIVFAKGSLENYCRENNIEYIKYNNFKDVINSLMEMII